MRNKGIATKALGLAIKKYQDKNVSEILITSYEFIFKKSYRK